MGVLAGDDEVGLVGAPALTVRLVPSARTVNVPSLSLSSQVVGHAIR